MNGPDSRRRARRRAGVVAGVVLVTSLVELPDRGPPPRDPLGVAGVDKWAHLFGYAVLARTLAAAVDARSWRSQAGVVCLVTGYGALLELLQRSLGGRLYEHGDVLANALGAALGVLARRAALAVTRPDGLPTSDR
ncbi:VanZ family protein [Halomarina rubra]|uniref:VanZ family protein n=1 Tax=Halomarina rubra TaxID=2071873 RepID=A0ABD6AXY1_9EURY|nr:VanZ family protein [Halomarina rubra]